MNFVDRTIEVKTETVGDRDEGMKDGERKRWVYNLSKFEID